MKTLLSLLFLLSVLPLRADDQILAEDDASDPAYRGGWKTESGGSGFGNWTLQSQKAEGAESYAGFFVADSTSTGSNPDSAAIALEGKAFGMFANGSGFEIASAFRPLKRPLAVGQTFSFLIKYGEFVKKTDKDDFAGGSVGITLRSGTASSSVEDYNKGARFEFGAYAGKPNYQIYDGEKTQDTGIPLTNGGLTVSVTVVTADTYDIEVTSFEDKKKTTLKGRKFGGTAGELIESFCIFDRNGEKNDAFFNGFQITAPSK